MSPIEQKIDGPVLIDPAVHGDDRGFFMETFRQSQLAELGLPEDLQFVQDNHSRPRRGAVRGMHLRVGDGVVKFVRCARGAIVDGARRRTPRVAHPREVGSV